MAIIKADDYRCFKCGNILKDLFHLKAAKKYTATVQALQHKVDNTIVFVPGGLYRHKRKCI